VLEPAIEANLVGARNSILSLFATRHLPSRKFQTKRSHTSNYIAEIVFERIRMVLKARFSRLPDSPCTNNCLAFMDVGRKVPGVSRIYIACVSLWSTPTPSPNGHDFVPVKLKKVNAPSRLACFHTQPSWEDLASKISDLFSISPKNVIVNFIDQRAL